MAGSLKWIQYTTDAGDAFALFADESNGEAAGTAVDVTGGTSTLYGIPSTVTPRYARYQDATGTIVRRAYISVNGTNPTTPINDPVSGASLDLVAIVAEQRRFVTGVDTGILDGDAT